MSGVAFHSGGLVLVRWSGGVGELVRDWRRFVDGERARGWAPSSTAVELLAALERLASGSISVSGSGEAPVGGGSAMMVRDEMSTSEAGRMLSLSRRQVWNLCESGRLRGRKPNGRMLVETQSVLAELARRGGEVPCATS